MLMLYQLLDLVLGVVFFIMLAHVIMSWLITFQILNLRQPFVYQLWDGLNRLLEPVYRPIRRVLPDTGALDLAGRARHGGGRSRDGISARVSGLGARDGRRYRRWGRRE